MKGLNLLLNCITLKASSSFIYEDIFRSLCSLSYSLQYNIRVLYYGYLEFNVTASIHLMTVEPNTEQNFLTLSKILLLCFESDSETVPTQLHFY